MGITTMMVSQSVLWPEIRLPKKKKKKLKTKLKRNRLQKSWRRGAQSISSGMVSSTTAPRPRFTTTPMDTSSDITHTPASPTHIPTIWDRKKLSGIVFFLSQTIWDKNYLG